MVSVTKDGYRVTTNGGDSFTISNRVGIEIMQAVEREYHKEDVLEYLKTADGIDENQISEEEIEDICDEYEDRLGDDDSWTYILRDIIESYSFSYKNKEE